MAKSSESRLHTTWDGRGITDVNALLRDPKVQETMRKLSRNRDPGSKKGYVTLLRYRKPD